MQTAANCCDDVQRGVTLGICMWYVERLSCVHHRCTHGKQTPIDLYDSKKDYISQKGPLLLLDPLQLALHNTSHLRYNPGKTPDDRNS